MITDKPFFTHLFCLSHLTMTYILCLCHTLLGMSASTPAGVSTESAAKISFAGSSSSTAQVSSSASATTASRFVYLALTLFIVC